MHMKILLALLVCCALALATATASAHTPTAAQQAALDVAVAQYEAGQHAAAGRSLQRLARQGMPAAHFSLAVMHLRGELPKPSRQRARALLLSAASAGLVTAQVMLGQSLEDGLFGARDLSAAHDWYERAAQAGSVEGQLAMGTAYFLGRGRPLDAAQAAYWYREAAKGGDVGAMYLIASQYEKGDGVPQDLRLAEYWYGQAAQQGDVAAQVKQRALHAAAGR